MLYKGYTVLIKPGFFGGGTASFVNVMRFVNKVIFFYVPREPPKYKVIVKIK